MQIIAEEAAKAIADLPEEARDILNWTVMYADNENGTFVIEWESPYEGGPVSKSRASRAEWTEASRQGMVKGRATLRAPGLEHEHRTFRTGGSAGVGHGL